MLIFKKRSISVKASSTDIVNALKNLPQKSILFNTFTESSFSFSMWPKRFEHMYGAIRFFGTIEEYGDECIIKYSIRPGVGFIFVLLIFFIPFVYSFMLLLFSTVPIMILAITGVTTLFIYLSIIGQEQVCDERLIRKLHELENKEV